MPLPDHIWVADPNPEGLPDFLWVNDHEDRKEGMSEFIRADSSSIEGSPREMDGEDDDPCTHRIIKRMEMQDGRGRTVRQWWRCAECGYDVNPFGGAGIEETSE